MAQAHIMETITRDEIRSLLAKEGPAVSIYFPTERVAVEAEANSLHLKNLLGRAHDELAGMGLRRPDIEKLLEPMDSLLGNGDFWHHQLDGLALFRTPDFFKYYRLPFKVDEFVIVGDRLHTKSLLPALAAEGHFYILALSQNRVRLLRATRHSVDEVDLSGLGIPLSLAEALQFDDLQKPELQHHPTMSPGRTDSGPSAPTQSGGKRQQAGRRHAFHGHGESGEGQKTQILRFFHGVDAGISKILGAEQAPLMLAGVEYLHPLYREANHYNFIVDDKIEGNPDQLSPKELHDKAVPKIEPYLRHDMDAARDRFGAQLSNGTASTDLHDVLRAAYQNRIDSVFVNRDERRWGNYDVANDRIEEHDERQQGDTDLLDLIGAQTLRTGGIVFLVEPEEMPVGEPVAAIYRF